MYSPMVKDLIQSFTCLPGVGSKTAQRMAFQLLDRHRQAASHLATCLNQALEHVGRCRDCQTFTEEAICSICVSQKRNSDHLCVVESPADIVAIEQTATYQGKYFVLMGNLSPIDGLGPDEIGLPRLFSQIKQRTIHEIILATSSTVEGEATAHYIADHAKQLGIFVSRIAHGVPLGGELEYIDGGTLAHALSGRRPI